jgi:hypothetical protein
MNWLADIFKSIINFITELIGIGPVIEPTPIKIGSRCYMPLFTRKANGAVSGTWEYLALPDPDKKAIRAYLKTNAKSGETPAITFCLTPSNVSGGFLPNSMAGVDAAQLDRLENECKTLIKDGVAIFLCLYVDASAPWWMQIEAHKGIWSQVHGRTCKYASGVILSIETNEQAANLGHIEGCINVMRSAMPGLDYYGTHLQWHGAGKGYAWTGSNGTPRNVNIILAEYDLDLAKADAIGVQVFKNQFGAIRAACGGVKWVSHEYNLNAGSSVNRACEQYQRDNGVWGIG